MALAEDTSGSITTDGTEQNFAASDTVSNVYQLRVDTGAMVDGDEIEVRCYAKTRTGDSEVEEWYGFYAHDQGANSQILTPPIPSPHSIRFTIKRLAGTDRAYPWAIYTYE